MKANQALYVRVGAVVLAGLGAIAAMVLWIGADSLRPTGERMETYFAESVQGLDPGAPVRFRGVEVGRVQSISLAFVEYREALANTRMDEPRARLVVVRFDADPRRVPRQDDQEFARMVASGLRVRMSSQGVTGVIYLEIDFLDPQRFPAEAVPWRPRDRVIPSVPSTLTQFQSQAEALLAQLREADIAGTLSDLRDLFGAFREQFVTGEGYAAMVAAADALRSLDATLRAAGPEAVATLAETRATAEALRRVAEGPLATDASAAANSLRTAMARLPGTLAAAESAARRLDSVGAEANRDIGPLLRDLRAAAENLRAVTEGMRQYPSQILFGAPPPRRE